MAPTLAHGKICYLAIPTQDIDRSAAFYEAVFGWRLRPRTDGTVAFDDGVGEVSGTWVVGPPPARDPGIVVYIMVDSLDVAIGAVRAHGGEIIGHLSPDAPEKTATFRDPYGNLFGLYQDRVPSP